MFFCQETNFFHLLSAIIFLYAETHYAFKYFPSRLKKREPEVIFDVPHRLEPGHTLPVLLLIKDADRYPVRIEQIKVRLFQGSVSKTLFERKFKNLATNQPFWWKILDLPLPPETHGDVLIDVEFSINCAGQVQEYHNDNYRISSHSPFRIHIAKDHLPKLPDWYFGDCHYHSSYTSDQVEFGAPIRPTIQLAKAFGLNFFAVTDHSYDLDDKADDFLHNDPELPKWHSLWREVDTVNDEESDFAVIPGEEISVGNAKNRNVHLLVFNDRQFYPGSGDSAEKWFRTKPEMRAHDVLDELNSKSSKELKLAFAAHPEIAPPFLEWLLIRRGSYHYSDYGHPNIAGMQIYNGINDKYFLRGIKKWVKLLLDYKRLFIISGNDAHGNFARFRQIGFPFLTMREHEDQLFGKGRTGVLVKDKITKLTILEALEKGRAIITDGPFATIQAKTDQGTFELGDTISDGRIQLRIFAQTTPEFGEFDSIELFEGDCLQKRESCVQNFTPQAGCGTFEKNVSVENLPKRGYFRLVCKTRRQSQEFWCLTNPIWIN